MNWEFELHQINRICFISLLFQDLLKFPKEYLKLSHSVNFDNFDNSISKLMKSVKIIV